MPAWRSCRWSPAWRRLPRCSRHPDTPRAPERKQESAQEPSGRDRARIQYLLADGFDGSSRGVRVRLTAFSSVLSGMMTFCPPAWHAAQLPSKTFLPTPASAASAGPTLPAKSAPATRAGAAALAACCATLESGNISKASATAAKARTLRSCEQINGWRSTDAARHQQLIHHLFTHSWEEAAPEKKSNMASVTQRVHPSTKCGAVRAACMRRAATLGACGPSLTGRR